MQDKRNMRPSVFISLTLAVVALLLATELDVRAKSKRASCVPFNQLLNIVVPAEKPASTGASIPSSLFGMTVLNFKNVQPLVQFGTTRTWDSYPNLDWSDANPSAGVYNFSYLDAFIAMNQARGADIVYTFGRTPQWASSNPTAAGPYGRGECAPPANLQNWDNYVTAIVTHVAGKIKYWEIWNEPQDPNFYCGSVTTMVTMAQQAYQIIKSINPGAMVITPSVTSMRGLPWLQSYLGAGGGSYADIMSFHGYWSSTAEDINTVISSYRSVLNANGQSAKPLWDTEASWAGAGTNVITDPKLRSAFVAKYYLLQWSAGISRFIWYAYDGAGIWGGLWDGVNGLHPDGMAYAQVYNWMVGASLVSPCSESSNGTWTCVISRSSGYQAEAIWNSISTVTYAVPTQFIQYHNLSGNITPVTGNSLTVGNLPVLLENESAF